MGRLSVMKSVYRAARHRSFLTQPTFSAKNRGVLADDSFVSIKGKCRGYLSQDRDEQAAKKDRFMKK